MYGATHGLDTVFFFRNFGTNVFSFAYGEANRPGREALSDAMEEGRRRLGRNPAKWDYGVYIELNVKQPVGTRIPIVGPYFNIGPVPMSGSSTSVKQTTQRIGPSMRFIADLGNWDRSLNNITIGQSGQFLSSHYKDQWDEYYVGKSLPMRWTGIRLWFSSRT